MKVAICMPWRGGVASRERVQQQIIGHYVGMGLSVFLGDSDPARPFNRSAARNAAAAAAGERDVYVFVDADAYIPERQLREAVVLAYGNAAAALPYTRIREMNPATGETRERVQLGNSPVVVSANVAISRPLWEKVRGWDERLSEWGWEDGAMLRAIRFLGDIISVPGTLVSVDHARSASEEPEVILAKRQRPAVLDDYDAAHTAEEMRAVMDAAYAARAIIDTERDTPAKQSEHPAK